MGDLLDLVLLLVAVRAIWRLLGGVMAGMATTQASRSSTSSTSSQDPQAAPPQGVQMARDPVCGTFVVPDQALSLTVGNSRVYFCSPACRDQYRAA